MTWDEVRGLARSPPGVEETTSYGAPAFAVGGKTFSCQPGNLALRDGGGGVLVLFDVEVEERAELTACQPEVFFFTDHFRNYPLVLMRLGAVGPDRLRPYLERSWRKRAPKRLLRALEPD